MMARSPLYFMAVKYSCLCSSMKGNRGLRNVSFPIMLLALLIRFSPWYSPEARSAAYSGVNQPSRAAFIAISITLILMRWLIPTFFSILFFLDSYKWYDHFQKVCTTMSYTVFVAKTVCISPHCPFFMHKKTLYDIRI